MDAPINSDVILDAIRSLFAAGTWWLYSGKKAQAIEASFARAHDSQYGVSTCNGTVPLEIVLRALGIGRGDKVILPAYDFYSLPKSVSNTGATPVFADTGNLNPTLGAQQVEVLLTPDVKAVVAAHLSGAVAELDRIAALCSKAGVYLIEDCAQASGAVYANRHAGSWGIAGVFSFGGVKLMTCGQGGMIITADQELYEKCFAIANRGRAPQGEMNRFGIIGDNFELSELSAAILAPQLEILAKLCHEREQVMAFLDSELAHIAGLTPINLFPQTQIRAQMRYCFYSSHNPDSLITRAQELGIPLCRTHKCVTSDERLFNRYASGQSFPNAEQAERELVGIHHTDILKGKEFWQEALEKLRKLVS